MALFSHKYFLKSKQLSILTAFYTEMYCNFDHIEKKKVFLRRMKIMRKIFFNFVQFSI